MRVSTETATAGIVGLLENIEKSLVRRLMKTSGKQPFLLVFIIVFLSMNKKRKKKSRARKGRKLLAGARRIVTEFRHFRRSICRKFDYSLPATPHIPLTHHDALRVQEPRHGSLP